MPKGTGFSPGNWGSPQGFKIMLSRISTRTEFCVFLKGANSDSVGCGNSQLNGEKIHFTEANHLSPHIVSAPGWPKFLSKDKSWLVQGFSLSFVGFGSPELG